MSTRISEEEHAERLAAIVEAMRFVKLQDQQDHLRQEIKEIAHVLNFLSTLIDAGELSADEIADELAFVEKRRQDKQALLDSLERLNT